MHLYIHIYTCLYIYMYTYANTCEYIYIYIYIYTNFVEHRYFLSTYFLLDPFVLPYCFYCIRWELIYVFSIIVFIPSTFCPTLGHHQGRIYYKSDVTFFFAYYIVVICKNKSYKSYITFVKIIVNENGHSNLSSNPAMSK